MPEKYLRMLRYDIHIARLTDRMLMDESTPQRYGTQCVAAPGGGVKPWLIAESELVDERQRTVGLMPLAENAVPLNAQQQRDRHV